jgi:hypothetical protein
MTLNITLVSPWIIYQSTDFRLTDANNASVTMSETAQKQVVLQYQNWCGLLCYTGIAKWASHDTEAWLPDALTHSGGSRSPRQIANTLAMHANSWIRGIPIDLRRHTFVLAAFEGRPIVYYISTFQRCGGNDLMKPLDHFDVTRYRPKQIKCLATGWTACLTEREKRELQSLMAAQPSVAQLSEAIAAVNAACATRSNNRVSPSSIVSEIRPNGEGGLHVYGSLPKTFVPTVVIANGANIAPQMSSVLGDEPHTLDGAAWNADAKMGVGGIAMSYRPV